MNELIGAASWISCLVCAALLLFGMRRDVVNPWIIFLLMSIFDIFLPAGLTAAGLDWAAQSMTSRWANYWVAPTARLMLGRAVLVAMISTVLFGTGYWVGGRFRIAKRVPYRFCRRRAWLILFAGLLGYLAFLLTQFAAHGSLARLLDYFLHNRFAGAAPQSEAQVSLAVGLDIYVLELVVLILFVQARSKTSRVFWFVAGVMVASLRGFRGSLLIYLLALAVLEQETIRRIGTAVARSLRRREARRRVYAFLAIGVVLFIGYGIVRNVATARFGQIKVGVVDSVLIEMDRVIRGEGLVGLASILDFYPGNAGFFHGKTIRDMLLLPVPRAIWTSKPSWYGIDDITRGMGWPEWTQSPVTMPGELYANFGYAGIALMFVYGLLFGMFATLAVNPRLRFVYALFLLPAMLTTFWMGFTGFVNHLVTVPLALLTLAIVFRPLRVVIVRRVAPRVALESPMRPLERV